ncbi:MAG: iron-containing alcohol dehydrogenase [Candidatus Accumulibacter sp.]|nr:iron-containing alcohol dehydrogenase [Accumulibacter sp.]
MNDRIIDFRMPRSLVMGVGAAGRLPDILQKSGIKKVLIVTDQGIVKAGLLPSISASIEAAGIGVAVFDGVEPDPRIEIVAACVAAFQASGAEAVVGLGGGSSIDIAKLVSIVAANGGQVVDYIGIGKVPGPGAPNFALPTTAGTGSEVTPIAILSDTSAHLKKGIVSEYLYPTAAIVDPALMVSAPPSVTAYTGMDTLTHAIEAYTNRFAVPFVDALALEAICQTGRHLRRAVSCGIDLEARSGMARAATLGGMCLGSVNTAAVHALAYPLGGTFNVPHGLANTVLLPAVMEFNMPANLGKYAAIAEALGEETCGLSRREAALLAIRAVKELSVDVGIPQGMRHLGIPEDAIPKMAEAAMEVTRLMNNNPRAITVKDVQRIYENAY